MAYEVTHRTEYRYSSTVSSSFGEVVMLPRDLPGQVCVRSQLVIDPKPHDVRERLDFFGNRVAYFAVLAPHTRLSVTARSLVRVRGRRAEPGPGGETPWEQVRDHIRADSPGTGPVTDPVTDPGADPEASPVADPEADPEADPVTDPVADPGASPVADPGAAADALDARQFVLDSPMVPISGQLAEYAAPSFPAARPVLAALADLSARIHRDFDYEPGATRVTTTIEEVLERRAGVCQDFAHLAIGCLRSLGLAARYVSGYLETRPPPGKERLAGADASHAWPSLFIPGTGWVDIDPTNDQLVNDRYITTAWGRDYADVSPLKGVIFTQADKRNLKVAVDVIPVDEPE